MSRVVLALYGVGLGMALTNAVIMLALDKHIGFAGSMAAGIWCLVQVGEGIAEDVE